MERDGHYVISLLSTFFSAKPKTMDTAAAVVAGGVPGRPVGGVTGGKYVPPNQRGGPEGRRGDAMASRFSARDGKWVKYCP